MADCREVTVNVPVEKDGDVVRVQIFTVAYRKVNEAAWTGLPAGVAKVPVVLRDKEGKLLANGTYYLRVLSGGKSSIGKLVILR